VKIMHAAMMANFCPGVVQQMRWEVEAAELASLPHQVMLFCSDQVKEDFPFLKKIHLPKNKILAYLKIRIQFQIWVLNNSADYDFVLLRYSASNVIQALFSFAWKNILTVHHTKEGPEINQAERRGAKFLSFLEWINSSIVLSNVRGIVSVTEEISRYERLRIRANERAFLDVLYPNGWSGSAGRLPVGNKKTDTIQILFVASDFSPWQGLDLLLKSVRDYQGSVLFTLHLVGSLDVKDKLVAEADERVVMYGRRESNFIDLLSASCSIALSSFALFRKGMDSACTLKVREYLSNGLPVYSGHRDVGFPLDFPFYRQGEPDIEKIIQYSNEVSDSTPVEVKNKASIYMEKSILLSRLHKEIEAASSK